MAPRDRGCAPGRHSGKRSGPRDRGRGEKGPRSRSAWYPENVQAPADLDRPQSGIAGIGLFEQPLIADPDFCRHSEFALNIHQFQLKVAGRARHRPLPYAAMRHSGCRDKLPPAKSVPEANEPRCNHLIRLKPILFVNASFHSSFMKMQSYTVRRSD